MFNIPQIIKNNRKTFYNFSSGKASSLWILNSVKLLLALLLTLIFSSVEKDLINAILTIYSILIGFSFNILFYLLSINKAKADRHTDSLERELKFEKLNKLSNELFYNVLYFSVISVLLILLSLAFFISGCISLHLKDFPLISVWLHTHLNVVYVKSFVSLGYSFLFYLVLIESIYSFLRTIGRVSYFFDQKLKIQSSN